MLDLSTILQIFTLLPFTPRNLTHFAVPRVWKSSGERSRALKLYHEILAKTPPNNHSESAKNCTRFFFQITITTLTKTAKQDSYYTLHSESHMYINNLRSSLKPTSEMKSCKLNLQMIQSWNSVQIFENFSRTSLRFSHLSKNSFSMNLSASRHSTAPTPQATIQPRITTSTRTGP